MPEKLMQKMDELGFNWVGKSEGRAPELEILLGWLGKDLNSIFQEDIRWIAWGHRGQHGCGETLEEALTHLVIVLKKEKDKENLKV